MHFATFLKVQFQVARRVGRKDYDGAIHGLERALSGSKNDTPYLELIAQCHHWAGRDEMAIASAKKALDIDPMSFGAVKFLSEIHARRTEHELAAQYVRRGLENFPEPLPTMPRVFFGILRLASFAFPRVKAVEKKAKENISDPNRNNNEWYAWAKQYLAWYDQGHGGRATPTIH